MEGDSGGGKPRKRRALPHVYYPRQQCPHCGEPNLRTTKTLPPGGDGSQSRYMRCADCGEGCIVVEEISRIWNAETGQAEN